MRVLALTHIRTFQLANAWTRNSFVWMCIIHAYSGALRALNALSLNPMEINVIVLFYCVPMLIILWIFYWDELIVVFVANAVRFHLVLFQLVSEPPSIFSSMCTSTLIIQIVDSRSKWLAIDRSINSIFLDDKWKIHICMHWNINSEYDFCLEDIWLQNLWTSKWIYAWLVGGVCTRPQ